MPTPAEMYRSSLLGHDDYSACLPGYDAAVVKRDTRVIRLFPMQSLEQLGSFRSGCLQRAKCHNVPVYLIGIGKSRVNRFEHLGCSLPPLYDKGANRAKIVALCFPHCLARNADPRTDRLV